MTFCRYNVHIFALFNREDIDFSFLHTFLPIGLFGKKTILCGHADMCNILAIIEIFDKYD